MGSIETGQGRVPAPSTFARVPAGVRAGGQFRAPERAEAPVELTSGAVRSQPRNLVGQVADAATALPAFGDGVVWDG